MTTDTAAVPSLTVGQHILAVPPLGHRRVCRVDRVSEDGLIVLSFPPPARQRALRLGNGCALADPGDRCVERVTGRHRGSSPRHPRFPHQRGNPAA